MSRDYHSNEKWIEKKALKKMPVRTAEEFNEMMASFGAGIEPAYIHRVLGDLGILNKEDEDFLWREAASQFAEFVATGWSDEGRDHTLSAGAAFRNAMEEMARAKNAVARIDELRAMARDEWCAKASQKFSIADRIVGNFGGSVNGIQLMSLEYYHRGDLNLDGTDRAAIKAMENAFAERAEGAPKWENVIGIRYYLPRLGRAMFGGQWKTPLARELGVSRDAVQDWAQGRMTPRPGVYADLLNAAKRRAEELADVIDALEKRQSNAP